MSKAKTYCYEYPRPAVTVDAVVFGLGSDGLRVLLIRRQAPPFDGAWALPGGFLELDEPIEDGVLRELHEETGLSEIALLAPLGVFGEPDRDPRERTISLAHVALVRGVLPNVSGRDDAAEAAWVAPDPDADYAFDHEEIIGQALTWLMIGVEGGPVARVLLPEVFVDADVVRLFRAVGLTKTDAIAWRKRLQMAGGVVSLGGSPRRYRVPEIDHAP